MGSYRPGNYFQPCARESASVSFHHATPQSFPVRLRLADITLTDQVADLNHIQGDFY